MTGGKKRWKRLVVIGVTGTMLSVSGAPLAKVRPAPIRPNIIVFLADDLGYADVGFQGYPASQEVVTPQIDALAQSGVVFKNAYVSNATCGPSRASLLTGRICSRFAMEDNLNLPAGDTGPPADEIIIPRILARHGYVSGAFGKWHLGESKGLTPADRGFDYYWGGRGGSGDYFFQHNPLPPVWNSSRSPDEAYMTDAITDEALAFIERSGDTPFFAYVAYNAPHSPFQTTKSLLERTVAARPQFASVYERMKLETKKWKGTRYNFGRFKGENLDQEILRLVYISMLLSEDDGIGEIVGLLEKKGIRENTLIFFLSDNGAALARPNDLGGVNLPLREGKGTIYEGGVRVPFVMSWPAVLKSERNETAIVSSMDIFTTTVELAGGEIPKDRVIDGVNLIPYLTGEKSGQPHEMLFFRRKDRNIWSFRMGDYKWVHNPRGGNRFEPAGGGLYFLPEDIGERRDLSAILPEKKEELQRMYEQLTADLPDPVRPHK